MYAAGGLPKEDTLMTQMEAQGLNADALRVQALQVLGSLSEDQLLVVISYARALLGEALAPKPSPLEDLVEEVV
jgi:hypothetical protein